MYDQICCICGRKIEGYGNNPRPLKDRGKCCDNCNTSMVIPARMKQTPYDKVKSKVYATGNKWAIENFNLTH